MIELCNETDRGGAGNGIVQPTDRGGEGNGIVKPTDRGGEGNGIVQPSLRGEGAKTRGRFRSSIPIALPS